MPKQWLSNFVQENLCHDSADGLAAAVQMSASHQELKVMRKVGNKKYKSNFLVFCSKSWGLLSLKVSFDLELATLIF
jgi:hypothetical protein